MSVTSAPIILDERVIGVFVWWAVKAIGAGELSGRQRQVLCLAAQGLRDGEIALRLQLSRSTVRQHLCNIHQHLNARNTTHAVVIALRLKILSLDEMVAH